MEPTKQCTKCERTLPLSSFRKQSGTKDGRQYNCKACASLRGRDRYEKKTESIKEQSKLYRAAHQEEYRGYMREYMKEVRSGEKT